jgi:hypothetical protein
MMDFLFMYGDDKLQLDNYYLLKSGDSVEINTLKVYISRISLMYDEDVVWKEDDSFHLVDASQENSWRLPLYIDSGLKYNSIQFKLGIDSLTNMAGAMGNDLDPTKEMYWTWQSGYINIKLEGKSNLSNARKNEFKYHLGGYSHPYNSSQSLAFDVETNEEIKVVFDLRSVLSGLDFGSLDHIMSPSIDAMNLSKRIAEIIRVYHD